eukprot:scaffold71135_cov30-Phaeocystis_antarctica.AAC.1
MSPNLNARGLGLGETPFRRWGGYRGLFIVSVDHCERTATPNYRSRYVHRLVLHRSAPPTGVAKYWCTKLSPASSFSARGKAFLSASFCRSGT